jgi:hypothetical protein
LYTIYENEYNALVEKFINQADNNGKIEVSYEKEKVCGRA